MKKLLLVWVLVATAFSSLLAQNKQVTGKVTSSEDGMALPGVNISLKGTSRGTSTDANGTYRIAVGAGATLQFTFVGHKSQSIVVGNQSTINVVLESDASELNEVVVTGAYGSKRSARSSTNNDQVVDQKALNTIRQTNLNNALAGKVSGIQVRSQSAAALGRSTEIRLRGVSGFGLGNGALYVVNGTILPNGDDLNLDDIENVSVLQGAAASAQFGSQGANGAIVITLKEAVPNQQGIGVTLNTGILFENPYILPNYQNSYAGGSTSDLMQYKWKAGQPEDWKALDGKYYHDYSDDASWGPRMVGQEYIPWYAWYAGSKYSFKTASLTPQPNNARDFYQTGVTKNNSFTINSASDKLKFKLTYGNQMIDGLLANTSLAKNTLNVLTSYNLNKHLTVSADINYVNQVQKGEIEDGYSNQSSGSFNQWFHRDLDMNIMKELKDLRTSEGIYASWNKANPDAYDPTNTRNFYAGNYWYNFFSWFDLVNQTNTRNRLFGNIAFTYKINDDLKITATYRKQQNNGMSDSRYSSRLNESGLQTTGNTPEARGYYATGQTYSDRTNMELFANYNKKIKDFTIDANVGTDFFEWNYVSNSANTNNGLSVADLYTVTNSVDPATIGNDRLTEKYRALIGKGTFGYKNMLFADVTIRNDWYSTLPQATNSVMSKSAGLSFVFGELISKALPWISYGKLRGSWGEIPKALGTSNETFGAYRFPGSAYNLGQNKWGSNFLMSASNTLVDPNIQGSVVTQGEVGLDLSFLNDRVGFSATYWEGSEKNFPYALSVNGASGYTSLLTNIGEISKKGLDIQLNGRPVVSRNFSWKISGTLSKLVANDIVSLSPKYGITQTAGVQGVWGTTMPYLVHTEGMRWGQLYGNGIKRINGVPVLDANGFYVNDPKVFFGSVLPDYTGGLQNSFTIMKDFTLNVNMDFQIGGKFASLSNMWGSYSGLTARTATVNEKGNPIRDAVADGGGVQTKGVNEKGEPVEFYVEAQDYFHNLYNNKTFDPYIYDLTFVKIREISFGYNLPVKKLGMSKYFQSVNISLVARNPVLLYATSKDFDPSEISAVSGETGQWPGTRGYGVNVRFGF
jgi:TonB-linked SusC/RagA family outer membrane protein